MVKRGAGAFSRDRGLGNVVIARYHRSVNWARHA
jgi:hypothetical protein